MEDWKQIRTLGRAEMMKRVARRFMNVTYDEPGKEHLLMFVIGGNQPQAEFTSAAMRRCEEYAAKQRATSPARGQRKQRRAAG